MREIVLDTETTGLHAAHGDRIVEVGAVELVDLKPTGRSFHAYINPRRGIPEASQRVHGLSWDFLRDKPIFDHVADTLLDLLEMDGEGNKSPAQIVAHNASFDMRFLNAELQICGLPPLSNPVVDTLALAKKRYPRGLKHNLDSLCKHFGIPLAVRSKRHGALIDAELLAKVYVELVADRQSGFEFTDGQRTADFGEVGQRPNPLPPRITAGEIAAHKRFVKEDMGRARIWLKYR